MVYARQKSPRRGRRNRLLARGSRSRNGSKLRITHDYSDDLNASYRISSHRGNSIAFADIFLLLVSPLRKGESHERTVDTRDGLWWNYLKILTAPMEQPRKEDRGWKKEICLSLSLSVNIHGKRYQYASYDSATSRAHPSTYCGLTPSNWHTRRRIRPCDRSLAPWAHPRATSSRSKRPGARHTCPPRSQSL